MLCRVSLLFILSMMLTSTIAHAEENVDNDSLEILRFKQAEAISLVPWYYYAAINQYEANIHTENDEKKDNIHIQIPEKKWYGFLPEHKPTAPEILEWFNGIGKDGDGDGIADPNNESDVLYTIGSLLTKYGQSEQDIKKALWDFYQRELSVLSIMNYAKLFQKYKQISFEQNAFPVPKTYNYSYRNTWGDARGFGGRRIHEGTDIFAGYGTPVRSTTYGVVELKGWNKYGGWRIGIRDIHNRYHYYAHLNGFAEGIEVGDIVEAGQTIGSVGSTGYGPPGTSGKFPPHLHYGMYKDNGNTEWSFDPYPYLKRWEKSDL
ncbi:M23 family metallopeptidase [Gracilibacillus sp. YIM 98692]|uniref:M23 family metallopeptidase n=1 Tax=Gracilibacillus sp. YIM 98692 TaxID=2663532 RepID=UPI001F09245A|nr:M23 family metallopeptidase [Gracilibacillus sp. YIM 98692]